MEEQMKRVVMKEMERKRQESSQFLYYFHAALEDEREQDDKEHEKVCREELKRMSMHYPFPSEPSNPLDRQEDEQEGEDTKVVCDEVLEEKD